jgi:hypothetical protein
MPLNRDLREFVELLNSNRVEYLIVGAFAVAYHGFPRYTGDLDILVRPNPENARRILEVLLIRNKENTGRAKDRGDAEELRRRS